MMSLLNLKALCIPPSLQLAVYHVYYITNARCVGSAEQRRWSSLDLCKILLMMCVYTLNAICTSKNKCNMYFKKII
jgi:hypothetical protein